MCVSVCPANILVFYFSSIRRDIDLKFIQDTYRVVLNSLKKLTFKGQGHRDGALLFEGTVISQKLSHGIISIFFHRHLLRYCKTRNVGGYYFGGFENIIIWQRFNLEILLEESGWGSIFVHLVTTNFGKIY